MLSILIPVYNYKISSLVNEVHKQVCESKIEFEIICLDDGSEKHRVENKTAIENLVFTSMFFSETNVGRIKSRQRLSDKASYDWLLFLDADVMPKHQTFIKKYIEESSSNHEAIYGGFTYHKNKPDNNSILRWTYGKRNEDVDFKKRNQNPYQIVISANFLIKKSIFNLINNSIDKKAYGLDNYFAALLKEHSINVFHINNEVYHLGLEKNDVYLKKIELAVDTLLWLSHRENLVHENKLLSLFMVLRNYKLNHIGSVFYKLFHLKIRKNLLSKNPNMLLLQFYKISYMCYKDLELNANKTN